MFGSMWSFSGRYWLRSFAVWGLFGSGVALALDDLPEQPAASAANLPHPQVVRSVDPVASAVILKLRSMDLTGLDVADFGDHDTVASR